MPKIPIDFSLGSYTDTDPLLGNRENYNCYPETTSGAVDKTILRSVEGYTAILKDVTTPINTAIFVDSTLYYIAGQSLYSSVYPYSSSTLISSSLSIAYATGPAKMVTNGKNIVIINLILTSPSFDYYYDIGSGTLATIESKDADFVTFGKAKDVVFKDGYYLFITEQALFHGDNVSTGDGLTFNPLSFAALPALSGDGTGLDVANGVVYVFTREKTFFYQTAGTTPFSFSRSVNQEMNIGISWSNAKTVFEDRIFIIGSERGSTQKPIIISGTSYQEVGNQSVSERVAAFVANNFVQVSSYKLRNHRFIQVNSHGLSFSTAPAVVLDFTETQIKGAPIWHYRKFPSNSGFSRNVIYYYLEPNRASPFSDSVVAIGGYGGSLGACLYRVVEDQSYGNSNTFGWITGTENRFQYTFPFIRQNSDSVSINKVSLRFTNDVSTVELQRSKQDGLFYPLGVIDLTNSSSKTAEWRRIGLIENDVSFRVIYKTDFVINEFTPQAGNKSGSLIEGYIEI